uniref:Coatomer subunit gamma n=1 Tax=Macrostomum lignano TaxID=282301 RepID=A0A1I8HQ01_9PLAT
MRRDKKDEEEGRASLYTGLEKSTVLQEARVFNETPLKVRRCTEILTKMLVILGQGEQLGRTEATEAFFAMTKLFQNKDVHLRRLVYIVIKEMATVAEDVIIVTSSLTKDMTGKEDAFRAPSIRALCRITDAGMLQSIERFMKQAIVDRSPPVSSAALVSAYQMFRSSQDVVRRWSNEVQEAVNSDSVMVQYHALGLLHQIRRSDRLAVTKLVQKYSKSSLRSPLAYCYLIRVASRLIQESSSGQDAASFEFLESCLRNKSELVVYEAARAIVALEQTSAKELAPAVSVLQMFLSSPKAVLRFAAVRTLNQVAMKHPAAVTACNLDLEQLIADSNSVRALCSKYPRKQAVMMTFLSQMLREEGSYDYKRSIVEALLAVIEENPESKEAGLSHLCEFIEDCEHPVLAVKTLHLLGDEGPKTMRPSKYIRYIYNRVILEVPLVRAAAVAALAKFGALHAPLLDSVLVLLDRCKLDTDDEVRDRATFYHRVLSLRNEQLASKFVLQPMQLSVVGLEQALLRYTQQSADSLQQKFDLRSVPVHTPAARPKPDEQLPEAFSAKQPAKSLETQADRYAKQLASVPELSALGSLFKSSEPVRLTEEETEYSVTCVKHAFSDYLLLQFDLLNTLPDQRLEDVHVDCVPSEDWELVKVIPAPALPYNTPATCYSVFRPTEPSACSLSCTLRFVVKDCDPATGQPDSDEGYADEYVLEELDIGVCDFVQPVIKPNFSAAWEELAPDSELEDTFALTSMASIVDAVQNLVKVLGLAACDRSDKPDPGKSTHTLHLAGVFRGGHDVLARCRLAASGQGVTMNMTVRASDPELSRLFIGAFPAQPHHSAAGSADAESGEVLLLRRQLQELVAVVVRQLVRLYEAQPTLVADLSGEVRCHIAVPRAADAGGPGHFGQRCRVDIYTDC